METKKLLQYNEQFYDDMWQNSIMASHEMWPIWKTIKACLTPGGKLLELGPGVRPRIPVKNSYFIEISTKAAEMLRKKGGNVEMPEKSTFLSTPEFFDVICAFEVLEHIPEDESIVGRISTAMKSGGKLFLSVPLHMKHWTEWDSIVGHKRRYSPAKLQEMLERNGLEIEAYAEDNIFSRVYMNSTSQKMAKYCIKRFPKLSMKLESYCLSLLCTFARKFKPIKWKHDSLEQVGESAVGIYVICRKA